MSLLLDRWNNEIKKKNQKVNNSSSTVNAGPQPATGNSTGSSKSKVTDAVLSNKTFYGGTGASGGSSGSTSSKTNKNSQYTAPTLGNAYDANTDYQAIINNAVENNDYVTAAKAEQLRNQKIIEMGSGYPTNKYSGWLDNTDYSTIGKQQMANGASWEDVLDTYNKRENKANGTLGLEEYANDEFQNMMLSYIEQQKALEQAQNMIDEWEEGNERPTEPKSDPRIDRLLDQYLNREAFSYDPMDDPLYQQYADQYRREGDRAMRETMAEAAASAGGMNSWAMTAANQANQYYNSQLNNIVPELYNLAYQKYLNGIELQVQDLGILQDMDATQYNRYRDTINDWYTDKNFAYGVYQNAVQQGNLKSNSDYNSKWDNINFNNSEAWKNKEWDYNDAWANKEWDYNDEWKNKEWDANQADKDLANSRYDQEAAKEEVWKYISLGVTPSADLIAKAGMTETDVALAVAAVKAEQAKSGGKTTSSDKTPSGDDAGYTEDDDDGYVEDDAPKPKTEDMSDYKVINIHGENWVSVSGLSGRHTWQEVVNMVNNGTIEEVIDTKNKTIYYRKA